MSMCSEVLFFILPTSTTRQPLAGLGEARRGGQRVDHLLGDELQVVLVELSESISMVFGSS